MQTIKLTPYEKTLIGQYLPGGEVVVLLDTSKAGFNVVLPDAFSTQKTMFTFICIGANNATLTPITGQYINDELLVTIYQWDTYSITAFDGTNYIAHKKSDHHKMVRQDNTWHAYGGFQDQAETITISTVDVWEHITNATNDLWTGLEADGLTLSGDVMTFTNGADYIGAVSISISASNGKDFQIRLYNTTQSTAMGYHVDASTTGANNYKNIVLPLYIEAAAGDEMRMEIRCTTDSSNPVVNSAVFYLTYLHD